MGDFNTPSVTQFFKKGNGGLVCYFKTAVLLPLMFGSFAFVFKTHFQFLIIVLNTFITVIIEKQAIRQAVCFSMLNHASTTSPIIRASFFRTSALFYIRTTHAGNLPFVLFAILTSKSITGTSVNTPTVVARAAGEVVPNSAIATATANSKKFDAPIIPAGAAIL